MSTDMDMRWWLQRTSVRLASAHTHTFIWNKSEMTKVVIVQTIKFSRLTHDISSHVTHINTIHNFPESCRWVLWVELLICKFGQTNEHMNMTNSTPFLSRSTIFCSMKNSLFWRKKLKCNKGWRAEKKDKNEVLITVHFIAI